MKINSNLAISDTGFIFNPSNGDSFSTNALGADIIRLMKEGKKTADIKKAICEKYEVDPKVLDKDYDDFMSHLRDHFLVSHD
ncbi:MAG: PqqD family protein [Bacteroidetes bacterium]|nr:PqqD family protein [Bacteroidota bacterium]